MAASEESQESRKRAFAQGGEATVAQAQEAQPAYSRRFQQDTPDCVLFTHQIVNRKRVQEPQVRGAAVALAQGLDRASALGASRGNTIAVGA